MRNWSPSTAFKRIIRPKILRNSRVRSSRVIFAPIFATGGCYVYHVLVACRWASRSESPSVLWTMFGPDVLGCRLASGPHSDLLSGLMLWTAPPRHESAIEVGAVRTSHDSEEPGHANDYDSWSRYREVSVSGSWRMCGWQRHQTRTQTPISHRSCDGHMKTDGHLGRGHLEGRAGDAANAIL